MRNAVILLLVCLLVLGGGAFLAFDLHKQCGQIALQVEYALEACQAQDKQSAQSALREAQLLWDDHAFLFKTTLGHSDLDNLLCLLARAHSSLQMDALPDAHRDLSQLLEALLAVKDELFPLAYNIL